jgi:hypothetical protein
VFIVWKTPNHPPADTDTRPSVAVRLIGAFGVVMRKVWPPPMKSPASLPR